MQRRNKSWGNGRMDVPLNTLPLLAESRSVIFEESPVNQGFFHILICQTSAYPYNIQKAEVNHATNEHPSMEQK